jgi:DNA polymerase III epsilon subunit-like protein
MIMAPSSAHAGPWLFIDTETTGKALHKCPPDHPDQPRIVQLAAILYDTQRKVVAEFNCLIKPEGFTIPQEATDIHGITTEQADTYGLKIGTALGVLCQFVKRAKLLVAHNAAFDCLVIHSELCRLKNADFLFLFMNCERHCTMEASTNVLRIPSPYRAGEFKWPKLSEAYAHFTGRELENAHDASADTKGCAAVYFAMNPLPISSPDAAQGATLDLED